MQFFMMGRQQTAQTKKIQNYVFSLADMLGKGNFSKVYRAINELTGEVVAVKVVELSSMRTPALVQLLYSEIEILKTLKHNNILNCFEVFTSANNCYIITEVCNDGDLESKLRKSGYIDEPSCRRHFFDVYQGLKYLAEQNIVHRDLKVANIFLKSGMAKIADFGFAKRTSEHFKDINIGSPIYMSPEGLLEGIYGPKTDVWAFGVFLYEMTQGDTPLGFCKSEAELKYHIQIPLTPDRFPRPIPPELKDLILRCLDINEQRRIGMKEVEHHPYMRSLFSQYIRENPRENIHQQGSLTNMTPKNMLQIPQRGYSPANSKVPAVQAPRGRSVDPGFSMKNNIQMRQHSPSRTPHNQSQNQNQSSTTIVNSLSPNQTAQNISSQSIHSRMNQHISNPLKHALTSQDILVCKIKFEESVHLLHYCRLIYKCLKDMQGFSTPPIPSFGYLRDVLTSWLLNILEEIRGKITTYVQFEGSKAAQREQKMKDVVKEYHEKYNLQLKKHHEGDCTLNAVNDRILQALKELSKSLDNPDQVNKWTLANYLITILQSNRALESCIESQNYKLLNEKINIEAFLNLSKKNGKSCAGLGIREHAAQILGNWADPDRK